MQKGRSFLQASCKIRKVAGHPSRTTLVEEELMKGRLTVSASLCAVAAALTVAACGGDSGSATSAAPSTASKLSTKPLTLTFLWFDWPPAHALEELGKEYTKTRPN